MMNRYMDNTDKSINFWVGADKCENMLNSIIFYCERKLNIEDSEKKRLFQVSASTLIKLGYDIKKYGYSENDIVYLDGESYKNLMASQDYYQSKIRNVTNKKDISNINDEDIGNVHKCR